MFGRIKKWILSGRGSDERNVLPGENANNPEETICSSLIKLCVKERKGKFSKMSQDCECFNCQAVSEHFSDCVVCMEPLQGVHIYACKSCGNFTCMQCSDKVSACPFCRCDFTDEANKIRNFAMERVLEQLMLPCRYKRWGCGMQLKSEERENHELSCSFVPTICPLIQFCGWQGNVGQMKAHLKEIHHTNLVSSNEINIELPEFHEKIFNEPTVPLFYTSALSCYGYIYICKLRIMLKKLILRFYQVPGLNTNKHKRFNAHLDIEAGKQKISGVVDIPPNITDDDDIYICGSVISIFAGEDDFVNINITILPRNEPSPIL